MNKHVIINTEAPVEILESLNDLGFNVIKIPILPSLAQPIQGHPDLQVFIHDKTIFCQKYIDRNILSLFKKIFNNVKLCQTVPKDPYPNDVAYNIVNLTKKVICNTKYIEPAIKQYLLEKNIEMIHVNQGYAKCSTLVLNQDSIITADNSIHIAASNNGVDSLLITPGFIQLPGYEYGFPGGASGQFDNTVYFTGTLSHHPDKKKIESFIFSKNKHIQYLSNGTIIDLGSLFFFSTVK